MADILVQELGFDPLDSTDPNFDFEIPEDLRNFDVDEFLGLQNDISGSQIDVDILLSKRFNPETPPIAKGDSQQLSPHSDDSGFYSPNSNCNKSDSNSCDFPNYAELTMYDPINGQFVQNINQFPETDQTPIITYAVISENRIQTSEPITVGPVFENYDLSDNQIAGNEVSFDSEAEENEDEEDCLSDKMLFSGTEMSSLPTFTSQKQGETAQNVKLTTEEKEMLALEGVRIPENVPLTKMEERILKRVRRKIRNRQSAHVSRQKKKDYIRNLELRVKKCTDVNSQLQIQIEKLEQQNSTLVQQLSHLKSIVTNKVSTGARHGRSLNATTGTCLMMVVFSCCFFMFPKSQLNISESETLPYKDMASVVSRTILSANKPSDFDSGDFKTSQFKKDYFGEFAEDSFGFPKRDAVEDLNGATPKAKEIEVKSYDEIIAEESPEWKTNNSKAEKVYLRQAFINKNDL